MVAKKLRYINGHFYDFETKEGIELGDNIEVTLSTGAANFKNGEKVGKHSKLKSAVELNKVILADPNIQECKKVFNAGTILYFRITHSIQHEFEVELLEDPFFYTKVSSKKNEGKLYDCACTVRENTIRRSKCLNKCKVVH